MSRDAHRRPDERTLLRPPEGVLDERRQEPVRRLDQRALRLLVGVLEQHLLVGHAGPVMDAVVRGQAVARSSSTVPREARAIIRKREMISRS